MLIKLLPSSLSNFIKFIYTKNNTLFFVLKHPSAKMEFNYKRNLIKGLLNKIENFHPKCKCINFKEIKAFISNKIDKKKMDSQESRIYYVERSHGEFSNDTENKELHDIFEQIRKEILKNNA
ncbi:hypothetical protein [Sulfurospirillum arcachonense]|uniref:hypothetical protein n=1 Tax=Sulfurospirillum arcachonense TaxID=57666 RepID=UPI0004B96371|nr:hypothetical protein [Sulfurospirillum arcachonense]